MTTVIHCGMPDEKRILSAAFPNLLVLSGQAKVNLPLVVPASCTRLISMGLCGGLAPGLKVPDVAIAAWVVDKSRDKSFSSASWNILAQTRLNEAGITNKIVPYYSSGLMDEADGIAQRASLFTKTGAWAIDDESRFTVAEAARRGIPFNVIRPLSDAFDDELPLMARGKIMNPDGSPNVPYLLSVLGQDQGEGAESVFTVAEHYRQSLEALEKTAKALAPLIAAD